MKPLLSESEDNDALRALGRASIQIVHDLKNQINGLKLYATFLRKRLEKSERPPDELETVNKLIAGLDRTATDLSLIVEFGQPLQLKKQAGTDLEKIVRAVAESLNDRPPVTGALTGPIVVAADPGALIGEFDSVLLGNALKSISHSALKMITGKQREASLQIHLTSETQKTRSNGLIEWCVLDSLDHDPFHSFAGSNEIRLALAARVIEAHGGSVEPGSGTLQVRLPLTS